MVDRRSLLVALAVLAGALGCGHEASSGAERGSKARDVVRLAKLPTPARLVALPDSSASLTEQDPDGSVRFISRGMRVMSRPDGSIERGKKLFPPSRQIRTLELPERLGGGFLFYSAGSGTTQLWRSGSWTGDLKVLGQLDFEAERVVDGFDRVYVQDSRSFDVVALDPESGKVLPLGPLPASPAYSSMAFADAWFGAVELPFRGVLVTFDAGASWRPLEVQSYGLSLERGEIAVNTMTGRWIIGPDGTLHQRGAGSDVDLAFQGAGRRPSAAPPTTATATPAEPPPSMPIGPLGKLPLVEALLHGIPDSEDTAVVARDGALGRVRLSDGKVLALDERAFPSGSSCTGVAFGKGVGFVCGRERGATVVYALDAPLTMRQVLRFEEPRYVASSGNGALVIRGPCRGSAAQAVGAYCIAADGRLSEMRVRGDLGVERVIALSDGRTAVLVPPRLGAPGTLTLVKGDGKATTVRLRLPKEDAPTLAMLRKGLWLDGFMEHKAAPEEPDAKAKSSGPKDQKKAEPKAAKKNKKKNDKPKKAQLAGWVVAAGPFVGVRVELDGTVRVGKIESDIDRAMISGPLGLVMGRSGTASETVDGGFEWNSVSLPADASSTAARASSQEIARGCSKVGCVVGTWMRVGWVASEEQDKDVETVDTPRYSSLPPSGGGRWKISCAPTGEMAGVTPKKRVSKPGLEGEEYGAIGLGGMYGGYGRHGRYGGYYGATPPPPPDESQGTEWLSFKGIQAPAKKKTELGFDLGTEHLSAQVRGYAWGARGASWDRVGNFMVRAYDDFSLKNAVWSTSVGRSPWGETSAVAGVFGQDINAPSAWQPVIEPSGRAAAILVNARGTSELLLAEEGRTSTLLQDAAKWGLYQLSGAVKVGSTWYLGSFISGSSFRLFRVENGRITLLKDYPMTGGWRPNTTLVANLVRNVRGDALGIWVEARRTRGSASSWFVYSVDPGSGDILDMIEVEPKQLATLPRACDEGAEGWLLIGEPPVEPYIDYMNGADSVRSHNFSAQIVVDARGLCVEALSAEADVEVPAKLGRGDDSSFSRSETLPLVLHERSRAGRRWGFRCTR